LRKMTGKKKGYDFSYVQQLGYDKFEQRVYLEYGNGTKTTYDYEPERRRLKGMTASTASKRAFMDNTYTYDAVNNILGLENKAEVPEANLMGGSSKYSYEYDDLYRLTTATGSYTDPNEQHAYTLSMEYNTVGGITQKTQSHQRKGATTGDEGWSVQKKTTYDMGYTYGGDLAHAPVHIGDKAYNYDGNGNMTGWTHDVSGQRRKLAWDEENRLRAVLDNGSVYHYIYDAGGQRVLKGQGKGQTVFVNGEEKGGSGQVGNFTVYVSPFVVLRSGNYTKHYYIEGQRIVSKLGGGWDGESTGQAGSGKVDFNKKEKQMQEGIVKNLKWLGLDGQALTAGKSGKTPPGQLNGTGGQSNPAEPNRYYYHPDHLGSTSYITDATGEVYQHLEYFAFGETFVEEHSNTDRTPYLYNGKELDEETGLYYYGARYYDAQTSIFISVDPLAEKYPGLSPYVYTFNNPIRYSDPTGMEGEEGNGGGRRQRKLDAKVDKLNNEMSQFNLDVQQGKYGVDEIIKKSDQYKEQADKLIDKFDKLNRKYNSGTTKVNGSLGLVVVGGVRYGTAHDENINDVNEAARKPRAASFLYARKLEDDEGRSMPDNAVILYTGINIDITEFKGNTSMSLYGTNNTQTFSTSGQRIFHTEANLTSDYSGSFSNVWPGVRGNVRAFSNPASNAGYAVRFTGGRASANIRFSLVATYYIPLKISNAFK
ncbi:MAG: RHS repeat-associated core domain-containing protein, partial [Cyclobacteriaceae bacterium]|nr:RHS repeat-associated core domain-containing protein [Cyclobacteriaceae bacterium]